MRDEKVTIDPADLNEETLVVKRCALVVKGGRRFSFSAHVVVGDDNGVLGLGHGKGREVATTIAKAGKDARRRLFRIEKDGNTVPHIVTGKFCSSKILIMPAKPGTGVIACTPVRAVMQLAGIHDVLTKSFGSTNTVNLVKAAIAGLQQLRSLQEVEAARGVKLS